MGENYALELRDISKRFGSVQANDHVDLTLRKSEILAILGENGSGKTTLMNMIYGIYYPDEGHIFVNGKEVTIRSPKDSYELGIGMVHQHFKLVDVLTAAENIVLGLPGKGKLDMKRITEDIQKLADKYGFELDLSQKIYEMSVSQKQTVEIIKMLYRGARILILDEPTNDLDIQTLTILEDYLDHFDGIIITVSHDRYFLDRIVNRIFSFEGDGKVRQFEGGYSDYLIRKELEGLDTEMSLKGHAAGTEEQPKKAESSSKDTWKQREPKLKFTFKEQREFESIDDDIAKLEEKIETLDAQIAANATNSVKLRELMEKKEETENALDEKMDRWVYLNDLNEKIQDAKQQG